MTLVSLPDSPMCSKHPLHRKPCPMCAQDGNVAYILLRNVANQAVNAPSVRGFNPPQEVCPNCYATEQDLAKVKGCIRCLKCGWKQDCNGW